MDKNIIFIAPAGAGKGTQAALMQEKYGFEHISTGEALREIASSGTEFGNKIADLINNGILVDDETMAELMKVKIGSFDKNKGIIFDGYPRTVAQAHRLEEILESFNRKVDYVIYLEVDREEAMRRVLGRLTCSNCGALYNKYSDKFNEEGHCNKCKGKLEHRDDDNEESFAVRFNTFLEKTKPILDYFKEKGLLNVVNSGISKEYTFEQVAKIIDKE